MLMLPILGLYGFYQYVDPPIWDRYWMTYTTIASIGQPEPFMVRVFSTMNAPAGYATFTAAALLLFGFRRARLGPAAGGGAVDAGAAAVMYRTAWIALAVGLLLGLFHPRTRRAGGDAAGRGAGLLAAATSFTPAGEIFEQRLQILRQRRTMRADRSDSANTRSCCNPMAARCSATVSATPT